MLKGNDKDQQYSGLKIKKQGGKNLCIDFVKKFVKSKKNQSCLKNRTQQGRATNSEKNSSKFPKVTTHTMIVESLNSIMK